MCFRSTSYTFFAARVCSPNFPPPLPLLVAAPVLLRRTPPTAHSLVSIALFSISSAAGLAPTAVSPASSGRDQLRIHRPARGGLRVGHAAAGAGSQQVRAASAWCPPVDSSCEPLLALVILVCCCPDDHNYVTADQSEIWYARREVSHACAWLFFWRF